MFLVGRVVMVPSSPLPPERLSFLPQSHHFGWGLFDSARLREQKLLLGEEKTASDRPYERRRRGGWRDKIPVLLRDLGEVSYTQSRKADDVIACCAQKRVL